MTLASVGPEIDGFTFVEHLGRGGYSDVYLYERRTPRMKVAVKVLTDSRLSEAERIQFAAEAEAMAELADHPYIVQVFSTDVTADGRPYLVMKYYPPPNLGVRCASEPLSVAQVLRTGIHIASAVETAHRAGILHRDIKPANVLVGAYGEPGLTDFGIAGRATDAGNDDDLGVSIPWSAPEVLNGSSNGSVASDVYSLAATLWHLLVGRSPFEVPGGDNSARALMGRVLRSPAPSTGRAEVAASLERLLRQAMAKSPQQRPRSAFELAQGLQRVEQELRLARTEIMVATTGEQRARSANGDRTLIRAPIAEAPRTTVRPAQARPTTPAAGSPSSFKPSAPAPAASSPRLSPLISDAPGGASAVATPGVARERRSAPSANAPATVRRPARVDESAPQGPAQGRRRGVKRSSVIMLASTLVVAIVVVGVVLATHGASPTPAKAPGSAVASDQLSGLVALPAAGPQAIAAPEVTATYAPATKVLTFRWTVAAGAKVGSYQVYRRGTDGYASTTKTFETLRAPAPDTVCISVAAVPSAGGAPSQQSPWTCGTAPR